MRSLGQSSKFVLATALLIGGAPHVASAHQGDYSALAERVSPAVVNIFTTQNAANTPADIPIPEDHPLRQFFERFGAPQTPGGEPIEASGSGFIFDSQGYVITNHHVVADSDSVRLRLSDEREYDARIVGTDERTDIALLKIEAAGGLPYVPLGDSDSVRVGEEVMAVGNPFGLGGTVTTGIVSAKGRSIRIGGPYIDYIQTDAAINRGNSGGPLFDMRGEVIGVNSAIYSPSGGSVGVGFAVPSNTVRRIVADLKDDGRVDRGWLGLRIQPVTDSIASALGLADRSGALVAGVDPDGPSAGMLQSGDLILAFNGVPVERSRDLPRIVARVAPDTAVPVRILRDGAEQVVTISLGQLEDDRRAALQPAARRAQHRSGPTGCRCPSRAPWSGRRRGGGDRTVQPCS